MDAARKLIHSLVSIPSLRPLREALAGATGRRRIPVLLRQYCLGHGIEIGAGPNPYCSPSNTVFLDRSTSNAHGTASADIVADCAQVPLPDASFDFVFSSHCLEHVQNTILTLNEWLRLLRPGGSLFLILPHADRTLDRHRARTTLDHHIRDFETLGDEPDRSHFAEMESGWRQLDDLGEWEALHRKIWKADFWDWDFRLTNDNFHFHVWTQDEMIRILHYLGLEILTVEERVRERGDSFIVIARKPLATA
ncbi:MAG: methyltransferase domain-containing protein [Sphingomicrobium sp.]